MMLNEVETICIGFALAYVWLQSSITVNGYKYSLKIVSPLTFHFKHSISSGATRQVPQLSVWVNIPLNVRLRKPSALSTNSLKNLCGPQYHSKRRELARSQSWQCGYTVRNWECILKYCLDECILYHSNEQNREYNPHLCMLLLRDPNV